MRIRSRASWTLLLVGLLQGSVGARAATFTVTTTDDSGPGTLRQAILDANVDSDPDVIAFAIGSGAQTIAPTTALPEITQPVDVDGTTQPGFAGTPLIEIDGTNVPAGLSGLVLSGHTGSRIHGLVINRFAVDFQTGGNGILISGGGGHTIDGNYLGTDLTGTVAQPNGRYGVACNGCTGCTIGGTTAAARNLLSGNADAGILVRDGTSNTIEGNWIGLSSAGTALGNDDGIFMLKGSGSGSQNNLIGGAAAGAANVIAGNGVGIVIGNSTTTGNVVRGNLIGTDPTGTVAIGHDFAGIEINSAPATTIEDNVIVGSGGPGIQIMNAAADGTIVRGNSIGVDADGLTAMPNGRGIEVSFSASGAPVGTTIGGVGGGNTIAHNTGAGIVVLSGIASNPMTFVSPTGVDVRENRIFSNGGLAIDLEDDGVTANDPGDVDDGANGLQNFPLVTGVTDLGDMTEFAGTLDAAAETTYRVELFESAAADPSGNGEGESPLGTADVVTDATGHADLTILLPVTVTPGAFVTATATDPDGNTSELSPAFLVPGGSTTSTTTEAPTTTTSSTDVSSTSTTSTAAPTSTTASTGPPVTITTTTSTEAPATSTVTSTTTSSSTVAPTTSSTSSTTTSTSAPPSSAPSTTTPVTTTTSTTLAPCPPPNGSPFDLLGCRLDALTASVAAAPELAALQPKLSTRLDAAAAGLADARSACQLRKTGRAKRTLGRVARALGQVVKTLRSRKARDVPEPLKTALVTDAKALQDDVALVKAGLVCP
jgi:hypothetical protein